MEFYVPYHHTPMFHPMPGKPSIYTHSPHAKTHGGKPGSECSLPQTRSTNGHQQMMGPDDLLQLSGPGTYGVQLPQPMCPASAGSADGRGPSSGSKDRRGQGIDQRREG